MWPQGRVISSLPCRPPSGPASSSSSSPSLLAKSLALEPPCSPCVHQEMLEPDVQRRRPGSSSAPPSLEAGAELAGPSGAGDGPPPVNDTGPPELPATTTPPSRRPPLPGPKPQSKKVCVCARVRVCPLFHRKMPLTRWSRPAVPPKPAHLQQQAGPSRPRLRAPDKPLPPPPPCRPLPADPRGARTPPTHGDGTASPTCVLSLIEKFER